MVLWEIDLTVQGGERYFFCNELNEKGEAVTWQGRQYQDTRLTAGFEMNGKGSSAAVADGVNLLVWSPGWRRTCRAWWGPRWSAAGCMPVFWMR
ncbi:phage minor tail L family protein [Escherichia coli B109]|nr:phage minor tail L family protein [Escherichia coli B109]